MSVISIVYLVLVLIVSLSNGVSGFKSMRFFMSKGQRSSESSCSMSMSSLASTDLNLAALPTIDEWMSVCDPELRKVTAAMFRAVKEISYKVSSWGVDI